MRRISGLRASQSAVQAHPARRNLVVRLREKRRRKARQIGSSKCRRCMDVDRDLHDTKLLITALVGQRDIGYALMFVGDLRARLARRVQITSDGLAIYLPAMDTAFGDDADYAMLQEIYGAAPEGERRYSPAKCLGARKREITGNPDPDHISTFYSRCGCTCVALPDLPTYSARRSRTIRARCAAFDVL